MNIRSLLFNLRMIPIKPFIDWTNKEFVMDLKRWSAICHISEKEQSRQLAQLLWQYPEFRNLYLYRNSSRRFYRLWFSCFYKPMESLYLVAGRIGGGVFIQHGFATIVAAESIGENCWINQQVTIGHKDHEGAPIIGDNVMITCGAKVLGHITIGDGAIIGANAVVVKDVEPGAKMVGVPAKRIN